MQQTGSYSRCNKPGATPSGFGKQFEPRWLRTCSDFHESHDCITAAHRELLPVQQTGSYSRSFTDRRGSFASIRFTRCWGAGEPRPGGRRAGRRWHSWGCLAPACENLFLTTETAHILRDDETASRLLTESYSRCNRPGATPDRSLTESYSRCNRPGATPDRSLTDGAPELVPSNQGTNPMAHKAAPRHIPLKNLRTTMPSWSGLPPQRQIRWKTKVPADSGGNPEFRRKSRGFRRKSEPGLPPRFDKYDLTLF